jgi:hypothetical protein
MAAAIQVDQELNMSEEIATFMLFLLHENRFQLSRLSIKQILLAKTRAGLNAEILTASVVARFPEIGIPTGPLIGGTPNVMEKYTNVLLEEIVDAIQGDMRIDVVTDPGATVIANGGNAGGPVVAVGATTTPHTGIGIAR